MWRGTSLPDLLGDFVGVQRLEPELHPNFDVSWQRKSQLIGNLAETRARRIRIRVTELGMVERILEAESRLQIELFSERDFFDHVNAFPVVERPSAKARLREW